MKEVMIGIILILTAAVIYFNIVSSIIATQDKDISSASIKITRIVFIGLVSIVGFALILRVTQQGEDSNLHYSLVPKFMQNW